MSGHCQSRNIGRKRTLSEDGHQQHVPLFWSQKIVEPKCTKTDLKKSQICPIWDQFDPGLMTKFDIPAEDIGQKLFKTQISYCIVFPLVSHVKSKRQALLYSLKKKTDNT